MNKTYTTLFALLTSFALLLLSPDDAYAKRLGGGKSFGGRPSYSQPYRPGPDAAPGYRAPPSAYQPAPQRNQALRDNFRNRGGLMGMLGGLALGGLLGAMLFGGGFEHINFFDIAVLGLIAYLLYRLLAARHRTPWNPAAAGSGASRRESYALGQGDQEPTSGGAVDRTHARFDTNLMFRGSSVAQSASADTPTDLPAGFDEQSFLDRAKQAFRHLQMAWDEGDTAEVRALTTPSVFDELSRQMLQRTEASRTRVMALEARLLEVGRHGTSDVASVLFDARIEEDDSGAPVVVREVWHFIRDRDSGRPTWFLDGIQQVGA